MRTLHPAFKLLIGIFVVGCGGFAGLVAPVFVGHLTGYGTGSYEDYLFIWMATVPAGTLLTGVLAWRMMRAPKMF